MADGSSVIGSASLDNLATNGKLLNQNISLLIQTLRAIFPQATETTATTATGGSATLPANPAGFLNVTINGTPVKVPYYNA